MFVQSLSHVQLCRLHGLQHARLFCPWISSGVGSTSCPLSRWCYLTISFSTIPSPPALSLSQHQVLFQWVGSSPLVAKRLELQLPSVLPMNTQDWFPLGLTGSITLLSEGLSKVFSSITIEKHQFFSIQLSLWSNSHIHVHDYWKNHNFNSMDLCQQSDFFPF